MPDLTEAAWKVYCALKWHAGGDGTSFPSLETLAKDTGLAGRSVRRACRELQEVGMIVVTPRTTTKGTRTSNLYQIGHGSTLQQEDNFAGVPGQKGQGDPDNFAGDVPGQKGQGNHIEHLTSSNEPECAPAPAGPPAKSPDQKLLGLCQWWNGMHDRAVVPHRVNPAAPSEAVIKGWNRVERSPELRDLVSDRARIESEIEASVFCREPWFRLEKLLGSKNRDGEFIIRKLLDGGYRNGSHKRNSHATGPGQRHADDDDRPIGVF